MCSLIRTFAPMKQRLLIVAGVSLFLLCSCQQKAKLPTYGEIKMQRIDSMIEAAQKEIPQLDSMLQRTQQRYDSLKRITDAHREALKATEKELNELGAMRLELDSMQVKFDTQCARVRFLNMKKVNKRTVTSLIAVMSMMVLFFLILTFPIVTLFN